MNQAYNVMRITKTYHLIQILNFNTGQSEAGGLSIRSKHRILLILLLRILQPYYRMTHRGTLMIDED